jgi:diketogulonate reductase-like aldo/keto reductase
VRGLAGRSGRRQRRSAAAALARPAGPARRHARGDERAARQGRIARLGVSNFPPRLLRQALELAPVLNDQVEFHPYEHQDELVDLARQRDVLITAYSPLARGRVANDPTLVEIGAAHGKTSGQVALRWLLDHPKTCVVPKAASHERRVENLDVFDFELGADEMTAIDGLDTGRRGGPEPDAITLEAFGREIPQA